jgi:hypothetical protein
MMLLIYDHVATTGPAIAGECGCAGRRCVHLLEIGRAV